MSSKMKNPYLNEDDFLAELLRLHPELRVEMLSNGERIIRGISLKTPDEMKKGSRHKLGRKARIKVVA